MAIYHCSVKISTEAVASLQWLRLHIVFGEKLEDETGLTHDYTHKTEVAYSEIILCENARGIPRRETLWNAVEEVKAKQRKACPRMGSGTSSSS